jgi:hypothetical protein
MYIDFIIKYIIKSMLCIRIRNGSSNNNNWYYILYYHMLSPDLYAFACLYQVYTPSADPVYHNGTGGL